MRNSKLIKKWVSKRRRLYVKQERKLTSVRRSLYTLEVIIIKFKNAKLILKMLFPS